MKAENSSQPQLTPEEIAEMQKKSQQEKITIPPQYANMPSELVEEMLAGGAILADPEMQKTELDRRKKIVEAIRLKEFAREQDKDEMYAKLYAKLPDDKKAVFSQRLQETVAKVSRYVKGEKNFDGLSNEEQLVLGKLKSAYEEFQKKNPGQEFNFKLGKEIDQKVLGNLQYKLAFESFRSKQMTDDEQKARDILAGLNGKKEFESNDNEKESREAMQKTMKREYGKILRSRSRSAISDDMFLVGKGELPDGKLYKKVDPEIGAYFDAHGISKDNQLDKLMALLDNGIDPNKEFYSASFEISNELKAALGAALGTAGGTAYKDGIAVVTSGFKEELKKDGIKHVFLNDVFSSLKEPLQKMYPNYKVHLLSEQRKVMEDEAREV